MRMSGKKANYLMLRLGVFEEKHHEILVGETFRVFVYLASMANGKRKPIGLVELGRNQLSRLLGVGPNTTSRALRRLEDAGYIRSEKRGYVVLKLRVEIGVQTGSETDPHHDPTLDPKRIHAGSETDPPTDTPTDPKRIQSGSETDPLNRVTATNKAVDGPYMVDGRANEKQTVDEEQDCAFGAGGETSAPEPQNAEDSAPEFSLTSEVEDSDPVIGPVFWDSGKDELSIDEDWLREEIESYQSDLGVDLSREEYEHEALRLRNELVRDPRLRACIKLASTGKPSSAAQFKRLASYVSGRFKETLQRKSDRATRPKRDGGSRVPTREHEGMLTRDADARAEDEAAIEACSLDHERDRVKSESGKHWLCRDRCGWYVLREEAT